MKKLGRREFLTRSAAGLAGLAVAGPVAGAVRGAGLGAEFGDGLGTAFSGSEASDEMPIGKVVLGNTGIRVSKLALGTGSIGGGSASNQTRLGQEAFTAMLRHGYERGVRFTDMAESYGSMPYVGAAIRELPRRELVLLSKMWTFADGSGREQSVRANIEKYLGLLGTDYIDILLMHCMMEGDWNKTRTHYMEGFTRAREEGLVRAVGVSCHDLGALRTAATEPWVDVIMARINPFGTVMDGPVEDVLDVLRIALANGKGIVGMKIFGEGRHVSDDEREESIGFGFRSAGVHAMTIGMETIDQLNDAIERVSRLAV